MEKYIEKFIKENTENNHRLLSSQGYLVPIISVLAKSKNHQEGDKLHVASMDIPTVFLESKERKEVLVEKVIPAMMDKVAEGDEDHKDILGICFTSEIWMRIGDVKKMKDFSKESILELPKQECIMNSYEFADGLVHMEVYYIHREGKMANEKGELIDCIRLEKSDKFDDINKQENDPEKKKTPVDTGGIFADMLKNYLESKKEKV